ncbi:MAG: DUF362 domain-containing protein [Syntrophorhabdales bacterium]|jgi:uncharacterized protein (DUF362 family)
MSRIVAGGCESYDEALLEEFFSRAFEEIAAPPAGCKVLLKPNLLVGKSPNKAVNTHPAFVRTVALMLLRGGCRVFVGDSPGYESTERALEKSGIMEVVRSLRLEIAPFRKRVTKVNNGISPYRELVFGEDPLDYDLVINMPKLKTHMMMGITAGVKNTFGFVPYLDKAKWHLRCKRDRLLFASVLMDIHAAVKPALTILDGVTGMDGNGPANGRVRHLGIVAVSDDALSLDAFLESRLPVPSPLPVSILAGEKGLLHETSVIDLGMPPVEDFLMPESMEVDWNLPSLLGETARRVFTVRPKWVRKRCNMCRTCVNVCPGGAIRTGETNILFDYRLCIRCYCCHEMCPTGAITV